MKPEIVLGCSTVDDGKPSQCDCTLGCVLMQQAINDGLPQVEGSVVTGRSMGSGVTKSLLVLQFGVDSSWQLNRKNSGRIIDPTK